MAPTYDEFKSLSDEELIRIYDETAANTSVGLEWFRWELEHRQMRRQTSTMIRLTWLIAVMTAANVVLVAATLLD